MISKDVSIIKREMIKEALEKYKEIHPPFIYKDLKECFTFEDGKILLWFNTADLSTKVIQRSIPS